MVANDPEFNIAMSQATEFSSQRKVGSMDITTWPTHCNLEITGEQWTANSDFYKETSIIRLNNLPEGVYKIVATAEGIQAQGGARSSRRRTIGLFYKLVRISIHRFEQENDESRAS